MKMKKKLLIICLIFVSKINSQNLEAGLSTGSGAIYIIENSEKNINLNYGIPAIISADLKYTPENSFFGLKLRYQNINGRLEGENWQNLNTAGLTLSVINGTIENRTLMFLLERINEKSKLNFGYNFGVGQTNEKINFDNKGIYKIENSFMILNFGGLMKYTLNSKLSLNLESSFLWNDPINAINAENYKIGAEDINLLFQIGINYKLK